MSLLIGVAKMPRVNLIQHLLVPASEVCLLLQRRQSRQVGLHERLGVRHHVFYRWLAVRLHLALNRRRMLPVNHHDLLREQKVL